MYFSISIHCRRVYLKPSVFIGPRASFDASIRFDARVSASPVSCPDPSTRCIAAIQPAAYVVSRHLIRFTQFSTSVHLAPWIISHAVSTAFDVLGSSSSIPVILEAFASVLHSSVFYVFSASLAIRLRCGADTRVAPVHCDTPVYPLVVRFSNVAFISLALQVVSAKVMPCCPLFRRLIRRFAISSLRRFHLLSFVAVNVRIK